MKFLKFLVVALVLLMLPTGCATTSSDSMMGKEKKWDCPCWSCKECKKDNAEASSCKANCAKCKKMKSKWSCKEGCDGCKSCTGDKCSCKDCGMKKKGCFGAHGDCTCKDKSCSDCTHCKKCSSCGSK